MAKAEEKIVCSRRLIPAMEFPDTCLRVAKNQTVWGKILQRELHFWAEAAKFCQTVLPVVLIGRHHLRTVHGCGLSAGLGHPGVAHQNHLGLTSSLESGLSVGANQAHRALQIGAGGSDKGITEPPGSAGRCGDAGANPE